MKIVADKIRRTLETVTAAILSTTDTRNRLMMFNEMLSHRSADHVAASVVLCTSRCARELCHVVIEFPQSIKGYRERKCAENYNI